MLSAQRPPACGGARGASHDPLRPPLRGEAALEPGVRAALRERPSPARPPGTVLPIGAHPSRDTFGEESPEGAPPVRKEGSERDLGPVVDLEAKLADLAGVLVVEDGIGLHLPEGFEALPKA